MRKQILVTGGSGSMESDLCERLLVDGLDVVCVDNFYTGSKINISHQPGKPSKFTMVEIAEPSAYFRGIFAN